MKDTPENIYLIDMGGEIVWCDEPYPDDGISEKDVTKYVRADAVRRYESVFDAIYKETEMAKEISRLVTKVERLKKDNFALAAGQCVHEKGTLAGEHGHSLCPITMQP